MQYNVFCESLRMRRIGILESCRTLAWGAPFVISRAQSDCAALKRDASHPSLPLRSVEDLDCASQRYNRVSPALSKTKSRATAPPIEAGAIRSALRINFNLPLPSPTAPDPPLPKRTACVLCEYSPPAACPPSVPVQTPNSPARSLCTNSPSTEFSR